MWNSGWIRRRIKISTNSLSRAAFGETYIRVTNVPSPDNPATSYLAALSILILLKNLDSPLVVGT